MGDLTAAFEQFPQFLLSPGNETLISQMKDRLQEYQAQELVLSLFKNLDDIQGEGPEFNAEVDIDIAEDGIYFLYYQDAGWVDCSAHAFETEEKQNAYCQSINQEVEYPALHFCSGVHP